VALFLMRLLMTFRSTAMESRQTPWNWSSVRLRLKPTEAELNWLSSPRRTNLLSTSPMRRFISEISSTVICRCQHMSAVSHACASTVCVSYRTTCSTISDHGCCSRSRSSNDSQPSRLLQQSASWPTNWLDTTATASFTCGRSTCARPA